MIKEVKRYTIQAAFTGSVAGPTEVVLACDYAALEQECKGLKAQHARDSAELRSLCKARDYARRERDAALLQVEALRELLLEASEEIACWGAYASDYFQEKHDLAGCVAKFHDAALQAKP